jgi:endonuclease/exonuclease/phosphatase family metal-dependent hydrolase
VTALLGFGLVAVPAVTTSTPALAAGYAKPSGVKGVSSRNSVALSWKAVPGAPAYRVQFSTSSKMSSAKTMDVRGTYLEWNYLDPDPGAGKGFTRLSANKNYYFRVKVISSVDLDHSAASLSSYSSTLKVKTRPSSSLPSLAPVNLASTSQGARSVYVSWSSRGPGVLYEVQYSTSSALTGASSSTFRYPEGVLSGLGAGGSYSYRVRAISADGKKTALSPWSAIARTASAKATSPAIKVAQYNICSYASGCSKYADWTTRRNALAKNIQLQDPDLIAMEEASKAGDLMSYLNGISPGRNYQIVARSSHAELAYDADRFTLGEWGEEAWSNDASKNSVWAVLTDTTSGRSFFAVATHLTNSDSASAQAKRPDQAAALVDLVKEKNSANLPVVIGGDFNVSKRKADHPLVYNTMKAGGYVDPIGNPSDSRYPDAAIAAEHPVDVGYASANQYISRAPKAKWLNGYDVDYIWVSGGVRVATYQIVVDLDTNGYFTGGLFGGLGKGEAPSDHNMVTATVHLP